MNKTMTFNVNQTNKAAKENAMNASKLINLNTIVKFVGLKLVTIVVATLIVASASAQLYATDPRYTGDTGPISESAFSDFRNYPQSTTTPAPVVTLETFQRWSSGVLAQQANEQARVSQYVSQVDAAVYAKYVAADRALWSWQYTHAPQAAEAYNLAQSEMKQLNDQRRQVLDQFYTTYVNVLTEMYKSDPNRQNNQQWYAQYINQYRTAQAQNAQR